MQSDKASQPEDQNRVKATATSTQAAKKSSPKTKSPAKNKAATAPAAPAEVKAGEKPVKKSTTKKATKTAVKADQKTTKDATKSQPAKKASAKQTSKSSTKPAKKSPLQITFRVAFATKFGQVIKVCGNHPALGDGSDEKALALDFADSDHWKGQASLDRLSLPEEGLQYYYLVQHSDGTIDKSSTYFLRPSTLPTKARHVLLRDAWNSPAFMENAFSTDVFKVLLKQPKSAKTSKSTGNHYFSVKAPQLAPTHVICLIGELTALGSWDTSKVILLEPDSDSNAWQTSLPIKTGSPSIQYKYGIYDTATQQFISFESGDNRILEADEDESAADQVQIHDGFVRTH